MLKFPSSGRTRLVVKNIGASFLLKGMSILITFLLVPMTLGYLNPYEYGIWLTLNSILSWVHFLDIGLGNGLRNKLAEAIAVKDYQLGKIYVSTTMSLMGLIITVFYVIFLLCQPFLDWYGILGVDTAKVSDLDSLVVLVFGFVCVGFVTRIVGNIYQAHQLSAVNDLIAFIGSVLSLLIIFILTKTTDGSLKSVALTFSAVPVAVSAIALPITFRKYPEITPSLRYVRFRHIRDLIFLGINFFVIQIAVIVVFMTSNVIISNLFGPEEVTPYNIASKYFSVLTFAFNIILSPIWTATTDANVRNDASWIRNTIRRLLFLWCGLVVAIVVMYGIAPYFYHFWVGDEVVISRQMTFWSGVYISILMLNNMFTIVINGYGKLRMQLVFAVLQAVIYIPLAIYCGHQFGVCGILIALCIVSAISLLWSPRQCWLLLNGKAKGIWNK